MKKLIKNIKLALKGILLWITIPIVLLSVCGIDSIADKGCDWFFGTIVVNIVLILICSFTITEEEFKILSGYNLLDKTFKLDEEGED